jgi:hypothetical protein
VIRLAIIIGAAAWLAMRGRKTQPALTPAGGVYPFDPAAVDALILPAIADGETNPAELATRALRVLYAETFDGAAIAWPVSSSAPANLLALQERTRTRARYLLALAAESGAREVY